MPSDFLLSLPQFSAFLAVAVMITLAPGPDNLMVLGLGMARGRRAGVAFGLGCALGCLNHTLLAALGVAALIAASPLAFTALRMLGGLYLVWLGAQAIRNARPVGAVRQGVAEAPRKLFVKGLIANAINPKVILFFLAFLPQFVDAPAGHVGLQMALLGAIFMVQTAVIFGAVAFFSGWIGAWLRRKPAIGARLNVFAGLTFIAIGIRVALPDMAPK